MTIYFDENFPPAIARGMATIQQGSREADIEVRTIFDTHRGVKDRQWLAQLDPGSTVITQDERIHRIRVEREIYRAHDVVLVVVKPAKKHGLSYWQMVEIIVKRWEEIKRVGREVRPAAYVVEFVSRKLRPL